MKFVKFNGGWWQLEGNLLINRVGGHCLADEEDKENYVEAKDWEYLDWINTGILSDKYKTGWIDRNGKFYGCDYMQHAYQAIYVHKKSSQELEQLGWVKVYQNKLLFNDIKPKYVIIKGHLNDYQKNTLRRLGFDLDE